MTRPLFLQLRDEFASRISSGVWQAGACIPNEACLASELGVSQGTVRKAVDLMEAEKLVTRRQGRGTFIIDANCEELACRFNSFFAETGQRINGMFEAVSGTTSEPELNEIDVLGIHRQEVVRRTHRRRSYSNKPFMCETSTVVMRHWPEISEAELDRLNLVQLAQRFGVFPSYATEQVQAQACPAAVSEQLEIEVNSPTLFISRVVYSDRGEKLQWRRGWCSPHLKYIAVTS